MGGEAGWATQPAGFGMHEVFSAGLEEMHNAVNAAITGALLKPAKKEQEPGLFGRVLSTVSRAASGCPEKPGDNVSVMSWDLVYGKVCVWQAGSTKYKSYVTTGTNKWNAHISTFREYGGSWTIIGVTISDVNKPKVPWVGATSNLGYMYFNMHFMDQTTTTDTERQNIVMHELGHALGLDHNKSTDIMWEKHSSKVTLSANDKASYDYAATRY